jgi:S-adenosylmethionine:diacylglycerol 3-amino-3-carboxypropyl transferase
MPKNKPFRQLSKSPVWFYALRIPPVQYDELVAGSSENPMEVMAVAFRLLVCDFLRDNYFAWQVVARHGGAKPSVSGAMIAKASVHGQTKRRFIRASWIDFRNKQPSLSLHGFVLRNAMPERASSRKALDRNRPHGCQRGCMRHLRGH